jgi:Co/Zn/Cd efflux system component
MTRNKDVKQGRILRSFPPLAAANFLFFCLEFILAIEARSASLFADSIAFLEGASVSVLLSSGRNWSMPGREAFARFFRTIILIPICFLFWMITATITAPRSRPRRRWPQPARRSGSLCDARNHAIMNAAVVLAAFLTWASGTMWPDALAALGILCVNASATEHIWLAAREPPLIDA